MLASMSSISKKFKYLEFAVFLLYKESGIILEFRPQNGLQHDVFFYPNTSAETTEERRHKFPLSS